jgi:hypothetical protein
MSWIDLKLLLLFLSSSGQHSYCPSLIQPHHGRVDDRRADSSTTFYPFNSFRNSSRRSLIYLFIYLFLFRSPSSVSLVFIFISTARLDGISAGGNCGGSTSHEGNGATLSGSSSGWRQIGPQRRDGESSKTHGRTTTGPTVHRYREVEKRWRLKNASRSTVDSPVALRLSRPTQLVGQRGKQLHQCPARRRFCWSLIIELI